MKKRNHVTINKTLFTDKQIEMICDKIDVILDAIPFLIMLAIPAIVVIVAIVWGKFK